MRTKREQRLTSRSVAREARIAALPLVLAFGVSLPALAPETRLGIGGVGRYEVVVIGDEFAREDADFNMAYEITDNGLVVGQVAVLDQRPAGLTRVNRALLYLTQPLFGFPAGQVTLLLSNWSNTGGTAAFAQGGNPVPEELALESEEELGFSIQFVGLGDIEGYKAWAATAPAPLREIIDEFVWDLTKGGVE
jgi:hypothetical protein